MQARTSARCSLALLRANERPWLPVRDAFFSPAHPHQQLCPLRNLVAPPFAALAGARAEVHPCRRGVTIPATVVAASVAAAAVPAVVAAASVFAAVTATAPADVTAAALAAIRKSRRLGPVHLLSKRRHFAPERPRLGRSRRRRSGAMAAKAAARTAEAPRASNSLVEFSSINRMSALA